MGRVYGRIEWSSSTLFAMSYPPIAPEKRPALFERQANSSFFDPDTGIPEWSWQRWHFHATGYFSDASIRYYERVISRLYNYTRESAVHREIARQARRLDPGSILEIGCGPGHALERFARWLPGVALTGVDLAPLMLERAASRLSGAATLLHRDASANLRGIAPQDLVVTIHVPGHVPAPVAERIIEQGTAILRPRGHWIMIEHAWHQLPPMPPGMRLVTHEKLLGGLQVLRVYRKAR